MQIGFMGAAESVTGSMHVIEVGGKRILLECGLFQGRRQESIDRNTHIPFDPSRIDAMILSHAHIDHSGNIPQLVKQGFEGSIFCTAATQDLAKVMLRDSAHIQEMDAIFLNKRLARKHLPPISPLYTVKDVEKSLNRFVGIGYNRPFEVADGVTVTFLEAGHILGSAIVALDVKEKSGTRRVVFTGDLGRKNMPIVRDPEQVREADIFITESTYGNRAHDPIEDMNAKLAGVVRDAADKKGKIIVPSFSVERTQELVFMLHQLFIEGMLPEIPIYVDSPLSVNITEVFRLHPECFDEEINELFVANHVDPFGFDHLRYIHDVEESKKLNDLDGPCMIISASGMCEAGRVLHHLANNVADPKNTVMVVGFMAEHTLGRRIVERQPFVKIFGEELPLNAKVVIMNGFSAHADRNELMEYFDGIGKNGLKRVFVVHGEPDQSEPFAQRLRERGAPEVTVPKLGEKFEI